MCNEPESNLMPYNNAEQLVYNALLCAAAYVHDNQLDDSVSTESKFQFIAETKDPKIIQFAFETAAVMTDDDKTNAKNLLKALSKAYPEVFPSYNWCTMKGSVRQALIQFTKFARCYKDYVLSLTEVLGSEQ